jgi:hypothetical protein
MGTLKITRGRQAVAARVVVHGTEGIGKTTLASQFPDALVLDTEDGSRHLDVARVSMGSWHDLTLAVSELAVDPQGFRSVVIDSADWAERMLIESMLKGSGKKSIEDFGFGKGYVILTEHFGRFLESCDKLISAGINVVFVAHTHVKRTSPPDQTDGFDRYELKLTKQVSPLLKEWADAVLFCNYRLQIVEGADGRMKATGGRERVIYTERAAAWDAKNRYGLPAEVPMAIGSLSPIFAHVPAALPAGGAADGTPEPAPTNHEESLLDTILRSVAETSNDRTIGRIKARVEELVASGQLTNDEANAIGKAIKAKEVPA